MNGVRARRAFALASLASSAVALGAAQGDEVAGRVFLLGLLIAALVALGLPAALLLHSLRADWIAAEARAFDRRKTACLLVGAGLVLAAIAVGAAAARRPPVGVAVWAAAVAWFLVGFAGCARRQGERLVGNCAGVRPLVLGWLARAGAFAVPALWPVVGAYLVVAAFGVPLVALFDRAKDEPPAPVI